MVRSITKDTVLWMSLAGRPSNIGTRFHNFLYAELSLDFVYKAFTTTDLAAAIAGIRALGIRGCGVSMPYKEACIEFVDAMDGSAEAIGSVNTIVNTDGQLRAYNTDYLASPSSWPTTRSRWVTPSPCSAAGAWPRPWSRRSVTRASTQGRWPRATPGGVGPG
jgi:shikimate 5-dehydrogenase